MPQFIGDASLKKEARVTGRTFLLCALAAMALVGCKKQSQGAATASSGQDATGFSPDRPLPPFPSSQPSPDVAMNEIDRHAILGRVARWHLSEMEVGQLELLLSHYGREIWPDAPTPINEQWIKTSSILSCEPLLRYQTSAHRFELRKGTLTITDAYAGYTPPGARAPTRRASTIGLSGEPGPGRITHDDFAEVSYFLSALFTVMPTEAQLLTLRRAFLTPGYLLNMAPMTVRMNNVLIDAKQADEVGTWPHRKGRFTVFVCSGAKLTIEMNGKVSAYSPPQTDKKQ